MTAPARNRRREDDRSRAEAGPPAGGRKSNVLLRTDLGRRMKIGLARSARVGTIMPAPRIPIGSRYHTSQSRRQCDGATPRRGERELSPVTTMRALVIDDNELVRDNVAEVLRGEG